MSEKESVLFSELSEDSLVNISGGATGVNFDYSSIPTQVVSEILNASAVPVNWEAVYIAYKNIQTTPS